VGFWVAAGMPASQHPLADPMDKVFICDFFPFLQEVQASVVFPALFAGNGCGRRNQLPF
jgi:hypothetical protein